MSLSISTYTVKITFQTVSLEHALGLEGNSFDHFQNTLNFHYNAQFYIATSDIGY